MKTDNIQKYKSKVKMKQKQKQTASILLLVTQLLFPVFFPSCTDDAADGDCLPDGMYPMTFTTTVQGLTETRATVDNTWAGTEEVAVKVKDEVKKYKADNSGNLTVDGDNPPFYWQNTTEKKTVSAWFPYSQTFPATFTVQEDQNSGTGYQQSDLLYAPPTEVTFKGDKSLTFRHLPARVVVNLKAGDGVTKEEVAGATVTLLNQATTSGAITVDEGSQTYTVAQAGADTKSITPKGVTATKDYQKTVQALLVPQKIKDKVFIKVVAAGNTYNYTPTDEADANFASGKQYTYQITVKKTGLAVTLSKNGEWGSGGDEAVSGKVPDNGYSASDLKVGDYYYSDGETSDGGYREYDSGGSTAVLDIRPVLTDAAGNSRTVVGIVFWVGDLTNNSDPLLKIEKSGCTHGLVVALQDASTSSLWSTSNEYITSKWLSSQGNTYGITTLETENKMQGYANTKALAAYNAAKGSGSDLRVLPVVAVGTYATAPGNSSGWYCPSVMELKYMCWGQNNSSGVAGKDMLNTQLGKVGGTSFQSDYYWSSSESGSGRAWTVSFANGYDGTDRKEYETWYGVRAVLAF